MTSIFHQIFISLYLKASKQSLVHIGTVVSEEIQFEFLHVHDLAPRSPSCYINVPSFLEIGPPVPEKIFEGFLPYMVMAAILVM